MKYDYFKSRALNETECGRLRLAVALDRQVSDHGRPHPEFARDGGRGARLLRGLERLVYDPAEPAEKPVLDWALCYARPKALTAIIERLSQAQTQGGLLGDLQKMAPAGLLRREYITPDYQRFQAAQDPPRSALICVTGNAHRLNVPVHHFHMLVHDAFDIVIYLRDDRRQHFLRGIPGMGENLEELADTLKRQIPDAARSCIVGTSSGGIAATHLAESLGSDRVALFSPEFSFNGVAAFADRSPLRADQLAIFASRGNPIDETFMNEWKKTRMAKAIRWIDVDTHGTLGYLVYTRQLGRLLKWLGGRT
jgi:hypothetical protein